MQAIFLSFFIMLRKVEAKIGRNGEVKENPKLYLYLQMKNGEYIITNIYPYVMNLNNWNRLTKERYEMLEEKIKKYPYFSLDSNNNIIGFEQKLTLSKLPFGQLSFIDENGNIRSSESENEIKNNKSKYIKTDFVNLKYVEAEMDRRAKADVIETSKFILKLKDEDGNYYHIDIIRYVRLLNGVSRVSPKLRKEIEENIKEKILEKSIEITKEGYIVDLFNLINVRKDWNKKKRK